VNAFQLTEEIMRRFSRVVMSVYVIEIGNSVDGDAPGIADSWTRSIRDNSKKFIAGGFLSGAKHTSALNAIAASLGYDSAAVVSSGSIPWANAISTARDNMQDFDNQVFWSFALHIGLSSPQSGCEPLFERGFDTIHAALWNSKLSYSAWTILAPRLPAPMPWNWWDSCQRLRRAVVDAYIDAGLDRDSFLRLTHSEEVSNMLIEIAEETARGRRFIRTSRLDSRDSRDV
jgi:hypothetical protein